MKSIKYTLTVSALFVLSFALDARGCGLPYFLPRYYYMYRVYTDPRSDDDYNRLFYHELTPEHRNCMDWQRETPSEVWDSHIHEVVYKMSLDNYRDFYNARKYRGKNTFARWIKTNRPDILDFLLLAKTNEHTRMRMNPRWYYPTMHTADTQTLEEIVQTALSRRDGSLGNRYLLQAMRALSSLQRYDECLALWDNDLSRLPVYDPIRQLGEDCAARAMVATGRYAEAIAYYAAKGDVASLRLCANKECAKSFSTTADIIEFVYDYCPDSPYLARALQQYIRQIEPKGYSFDRDSQAADITPEYKQLYRFALRVAAESRCPNPAMWYYTAAFIADLEDDPQRASQILSRAESARGTEFIKNSVRLMRICLDAKMLPYDAAYERKLMGQLQWLDDKVRNNITPDIANITSILYNLQQNMSYYYWNDMLRRILLGEVCPRMVRLGRTTRALQLANMADNRLFNLVDNIDVRWCRGCGPNNYSSFTMDYYRTSGLEIFNSNVGGYFNSIDYSNDFFKMLDTLPTDRVIAYRDRVLHPQDEFDRFLNTRGYINSDFLCDIIGTKYLRAMRYADAERYLGMIKNPEINFMLNVTDYYLYSPFSINEEDDRPKDNFRYRFAREMNMLERQMNSADNPDTRAKAMVRYAVGMRNSFGQCWVLTQYYKYTEPEYYNLPDWEHSPECLNALHRSDSLIVLACSIATDREFAASVQYAFNNYRTVVEQYPETGTACIVRHSCDRLIDYCPNLRSR